MLKCASGGDPHILGLVTMTMIIIVIMTMMQMIIIDHLDQS